MASHSWGPSSLGHGTRQCKNCYCTYEEAYYALGMDCPKAPAPPPPASEKEKELLLGNLRSIQLLVHKKQTGDLR
jgi:hypothetical protein